MNTDPYLINFGHTKDADDAYMFWGLTENKVNLDNLTFKHILTTIQDLNEKALEEVYQVSALSVSMLPHVSDKYDLLKSGGCFGEGYGPTLIKKKDKDFQLENANIGFPGKYTSAFLAFNIYYYHLFNKKPEGITFLPFDQISKAIQEEKIDAGILIHEGQLSFEEQGYELIVDLGKWWTDKTSLPLPLGVDVVQKKLPHPVKSRISEIIRESILASKKHHEEAVEYALKYARGMNKTKSDKFIGMYINDRTLNMGEDGVESIRLFLEYGNKLGLNPEFNMDLI